MSTSRLVQVDSARLFLFRRGLLATAVAASLVLPVVGHVVAAAQAAGPAELAGTTTVTASSAASIPVRLTNVATFDVLRPGPGSNIIGRGRAIGVVLASTRTLDFVGLFRYGFCAAKGCQAKLPEGGQDPGGVSNQAYTALHLVDWSIGQKGVTIPPGEYRLIVVTDGTPVSATLHLKGLPGRTTFRARRPVQTLLNVQVAAPIAGSGYVTPEVDAGATLRHDGRHRWVGFVANWALTESDLDAKHPAGLWSYEDWICGYPGGASAGAGVDPYGPGCPDVPSNDLRSSVGEECQQYYPTGLEFGAAGAPVVGGYESIVGSCSFTITPREDLSIGMGAVSTATAAGAMAVAIQL